MDNLLAGKLLPDSGQGQESSVFLLQLGHLGDVVLLGCVLILACMQPAQSINSRKIQHNHRKNCDAPFWASQAPHFAFPAQRRVCALQTTLQRTVVQQQLLPLGSNMPGLLVFTSPTVACRQSSKLLPAFTCSSH